MHHSSAKLHCALTRLGADGSCGVSPQQKWFTRSSANEKGMGAFIFRLMLTLGHSYWLFHTICCYPDFWLHSFLCIIINNCPAGFSFTDKLIAALKENQMILAELSSHTGTRAPGIEHLATNFSSIVSQSIAEIAEQNRCQELLIAANSKTSHERSLQAQILLSKLTSSGQNWELRKFSLLFLRRSKIACWLALLLVLKV